VVRLAPLSSKFCPWFHFHALSDNYRPILERVLDSGDGILPYTGNFEKLDICETGHHRPNKLDERREIDNHRLYKTNTRKSIIHRLETLDLANRNPSDFEVNYDVNIHSQEFRYNQKANTLNGIDGTGPWGNHTLHDVRQSSLQSVLDVEILRPQLCMHVDGDLKDSSNTSKVNEYYDTSKVRIRILSDGEKARLAQHECQEEGVLNPTILPYAAADIPQVLQAETVLGEAYKNLLEYSLHPMAPIASKYTGPKPSYFERIPLGDPGLSSSSLFFAHQKTYIEPAKRDVREEHRFLRESFLKMAQGNFAPHHPQFPKGGLRLLPTGELRKEADLQTIVERQEQQKKKRLDGMVKGSFPPGLVPARGQGRANVGFGTKGMGFGDIKSAFGTGIVA
jgi:hypothetical protein